MLFHILASLHKCCSFYANNTRIKIFINSTLQTYIIQCNYHLVNHQTDWDLKRQGVTKVLMECANYNNWNTF